MINHSRIFALTRYKIDDKDKITHFDNNNNNNNNNFLFAPYTFN